MLWVGTSGVGNGKLGFSSHPLRGRFSRCGPKVFGERLAVHGIAKEDVDRLAWRCRPGECDSLPERWITLQEQCKYKVILHLPGVSDWLEHFKHQLSCGSLNVFITEKPEKHRRDLRREAEVAATPPLAAPLFEHFDFWAPLVREGVHYVHVQIPRRQHGAEICEALHAALARLDPVKMRCIAEAGQQLARNLTMDQVHEYMAAVLRRAAAAQKPEVVRTLTTQAQHSLVTKRNLLRHTSESTRPWIERIFLPSHGVFPRNRTRASINIKSKSEGEDVGGAQGGRRGGGALARAKAVVETFKR
jgi:hypothetical protein